MSVMILKKVFIYSILSFLPLPFFGQQELVLKQKEVTALNLDTIDAPIADGLSKFLGCAYSTSQKKDFEKYWNQVTPENSAKWGSIEGTRDVMNWTQLDEAYNFAMTHNFPFKLHCMIWGNQQPDWIRLLDSTQQRQEIEEWFQLAAERYDSVSMVEIVNEPLNDPPSQNVSGGGYYMETLGGYGETGWDWVLESFRIGKKYFNDTVIFMLNDYNIVGDQVNTMRYLEIVKLLQADTLIDAIGIQAHSFSTSGRSQSELKRNLDSLATSGLPIYATELDIDGLDEITQVRDYQKIFTTIWEHPAVKGITLWGFRPGLWRSEQKAYIINSNNSKRLALQWLEAYVTGTYLPVSNITVTSEDNVNQITNDGDSLQMYADVLPVNSTIDTVTWSVSNSSIATISSSGLLTAKENGVVTVRANSVDFGSTVKGTMEITISNQIASTEENELPGLEIYPNPATDGVFTIKTTELVSKVKIMDVRGVVVFESNNIDSKEMQFDLNVSSGIYFVQFIDGNKYAYRKMMIE